jgi:hypothetical protein
VELSGTRWNRVIVCKWRWGYVLRLAFKHESGGYARHAQPLLQKLLEQLACLSVDDTCCLAIPQRAWHVVVHTVDERCKRLHLWKFAASKCVNQRRACENTAEGECNNRTLTQVYHCGSDCDDTTEGEGSRRTSRHAKPSSTLTLLVYTDK